MSHNVTCDGTVSGIKNKKFGESWLPLFRFLEKDQAEINEQSREKRGEITKTLTIVLPIALFIHPGRAAGINPNTKILLAMIEMTPDLRLMLQNTQSQVESLSVSSNSVIRDVRRDHPVSAQKKECKRLG